MCGVVELKYCVMSISIFYHISDGWFGLTGNFDYAKFDYSLIDLILLNMQIGCIKTILFFVDTHLTNFLFLSFIVQQKLL